MKTKLNRVRKMIRENIVNQLLPEDAQVFRDFVTEKEGVTYEYQTPQYLNQVITWCASPDEVGKNLAVKAWQILPPSIRLQVSDAMPTTDLRWMVLALGFSKHAVQLQMKQKSLSEEYAVIMRYGASAISSAENCLVKGTSCWEAEADRDNFWRLVEEVDDTLADWDTHVQAVIASTNVNDPDKFAAVVKAHNALLMHISQYEKVSKIINDILPNPAESPVVD